MEIEINGLDLHELAIWLKRRHAQVQVYRMRFEITDTLGAIQYVLRELANKQWCSEERKQLEQACVEAMGRLEAKAETQKQQIRAALRRLVTEIHIDSEAA